MTPEDLDIMQREKGREKRPGFLQRRNAKIIAPYRAMIEYGNLSLLVIHHPSAMYDYYVLQSFHKTLGSFKHVLLNLEIPKIAVGYRPGFFDMFGEKIECEKMKKS